MILAVLNTKDQWNSDGILLQTVNLMDRILLRFCCGKHSGIILSTMDSITLSIFSLDHYLFHHSISQDFDLSSTHDP